MARDAIAVYIDDSSIRLLSVSGKRPRQWAAEPLEAGLVRDGFIVDEPAVAEKVRLLWAKELPGSQRIIAGISGVNCLYRLLTLPDLPKNMLPEAVRREASRAFGMSLDQLYISWQTLPGKPGETQVYVAAAARTTVDAVMRTLKRAGLNPHVMDIAPLALARSTAEPSALIVDLQQASLDIVVKIDAMPEVIRSVAVSRSASPADRLKLVRQELQRAVTFYNSGHPGTPVADDIPILVSGELGEQQDLWQELLGRGERRIEPLKTPLESPEGFVPFLYAPVIGFVLKETAGRGAEAYSRINFNALPETYIPKPRPLSELLFPPALIVGGLAVAALGFMVFNAHGLTEALRGRESANNQLVVSLGAQVAAQRSALEEERDILAARVEDDEALAGEKEARADVLDSRLRSFTLQEQAINTDLGEIHRTPGGVHLGSINHGESIVDVSGWGNTEHAVFTYARQLRASGRWSLVTLTRMRPDDIRIAFSITLHK